MPYFKKTKVYIIIRIVEVSKYVYSYPYKSQTSLTNIDLL